MSSIPLIVISDPDEPGAAEIYVEGSVNSAPRRFLLDTGAARSSVAADAFSETLPTAGEHHSSGTFSHTVDDLVIVDQLTVGPIQRTGFQITRAREHTSARASLIGMDILKDHCCHFRFDRQRLDVDTNPATAGAPFTPLTLDQKFHPYVTVRLGEVSANAVWDTGASLTVVDLNFIRAHAAHFSAAGHSIGTDANGTQVETAMYLMDAAQIGGRTFPPHRVAAVDLSPVNAAIEIPMDLIVGYNLYSQANWLFDFPNRRWAFM